jgi:hypothetical protein
MSGETSAQPADEAQRLRDEIERTREHLGDTVEQLAAKADVKQQAKAEAARLTERARVTVARARGQAMLTAAKVRGKRRQATQQAVTAGQAGQDRLRRQAAHAKVTAPGAAKQAFDRGAKVVRGQRGPLAAAAGALLAALVGLIIWNRRKR